MPTDPDKPRASRRKAASIFALAAFLAFEAPADAQGAGGEPSLRVATIGAPQDVFSAANRCDGDDVPDVNARAIRTASGQTILFALHDLNRALKGPSLDALSIDCTSPFHGHGNPDPAAYDDVAWIASLWSADGRSIVALIHHEYHAGEHPGQCIARSAMACWYNTILEAVSDDEGRSFAKSAAPVVASAPFRQNIDQTRHRGFFNPSNIVAYDGAFYFFASTTGWPGQNSGACLFRSSTPEDAASWRAYDGRAFSIAFRDPYGAPAAAPKPCAIIEPFHFPVGSVTRFRPTGEFLAVWQAKRDAGAMPASGFYYATSHNLREWSAPRLLLAGPTLYDDVCASGGRLINYPSILDSAAETRTYEDAGAHPWMYFASLRAHGCEITSDRVLLRQRLAISPRSGPEPETSR